MARIERQRLDELDAKYRGTCFEEVCNGFTEEKALTEATRCLNCKTAPCMTGCPVSVHIPEFIAQIKQKNYEEAFKIIKGTNSLPAVCGRVCPQERQCESKCVRAKMEGAVAIGSLERFVADYALKNGIKEKATGEKKGKKVAVIGSGPAGLSCAGSLAKEGVDVTVYEAFHETGGVLLYGIPQFRLPKELVKSEIEGLKDLGVNFVTNVIIGKTIFLDELLSEYDAVFVGTGAGLPMFMNIPGENLNGVYSANEYLTRVNLMGAWKDGSITPLIKGKNIVVVGAGNVAMDAARTALRMKAEKVSVVYRRSREEMPARGEEIRHAEEEGIDFKLLNNPVEILGENGWVKGIKCVKMELGEMDASGRRRPVEIPNSEYEIPCDVVIMSLGTSPNPLLKNSCSELEVSKRGTIVVDENTMMTNIENLYAGGDAVTGAATVITAMGAGRRAAETILKKFN